MKRIVLSLFIAVTVLAVMFSVTPSIYASENGAKAVSVSFPKPKAFRAAVAGITNYLADDVFDKNGNYDSEKFHTYSEVSGSIEEYFIHVLDQGTWTGKAEDTWHVDNLCLVRIGDLSEYTLALDVTFDEEYYFVHNIKDSSAEKHVFDETTIALQVPEALVETGRDFDKISGIIESGKYLEKSAEFSGINSSTKVFRNIHRSKKGKQSISYIAINESDGTACRIFSNALRIINGTISGDAGSEFSITFYDVDHDYTLDFTRDGDSIFYFDSSDEKEEYDLTGVTEFKSIYDELKEKEYKIAHYEDKFENIGQIIEFGAYEQDGDASNGKEPLRWVVLENDGKNALLLSTYVIEFMIYNDPKISTDPVKVCWWSKSTIRSWLNGEFYENTFTAEEKSQIIPITITEKEDKNEVTTDYNVILPGKDIVEQFLPTDADRIARQTDGISNPNSFDRESCGWMLYDGVSNLKKVWVTSKGKISSELNTYKDTEGVRPAIIINASYID